MLTFSSTTMQSVIWRDLRRRMISSSFSFARGSETDVESRKPNLPIFRVLSAAQYRFQHIAHSGASLLASMTAFPYLAIMVA